ncbi:MAG: flagellar basal body-associated FliL family protein [bacterium]
MNEFNEVQEGAEGIELPDVDVEAGGELLPGKSEGGGGGGKSVVFAVVVVIILAFQAVSSHFIVKNLFFSEPPAPKQQKAETSDEIGEIYRITGLIVNPKESRGSKHLLVDFGLETKDKKVMDELLKIEPLLRDNLNTFFAAQRLEILQDITYREKLRKRVQEIVNYHLTEGTVDEVFFIQYVLQ